MRGDSIRGWVAAGAIALLGTLPACGEQDGNGAGGGEPGGGGGASAAGMSLAGTVTVDDAPVAGARVRLYRADGNGRAAGGETITSANGRFSFQELPLGTYSLEASRPGYGAAHADDVILQSDLGDVALALAARDGARYQLSGHVLGDASSGAQPFEGAAVRLEPADGPLAPEQQSTARDGSFAFRVPAGSYRLAVSARGYDDLTSPDVVVTDAGRGGLVLLPARTGVEAHTLAGQVRDADGPLPGVTVSLSRRAGSALAAVAGTETGPDGSFAFVGAPAGTYALRFDKSGYAEADVQPVELAADTRAVSAGLVPTSVARFRFAVQADLHIYTSGEIPVGLKSIIRGTIEHVRPSFVVLDGDMTSGVSSTVDPAEIGHYWDSFFDAIAGYTPSHIYTFPARGNHDYYSAAEQQAYADRWAGLSVPGVELHGDVVSYYSFDFANSHFTVLAGNTTELGSEQTDWLRADLASAAQRAHRFVFSHIPFIDEMAHGHGTIHGTTSDGVSLEDVLRNGHIDALFVGHEHVYLDDATTVPGIRQVMCGTAAGTYNFPFADGTLQELTPSMVVVDVAGAEVSIEGVRDAPFFETTWQGRTIAPPPRRLIPGPGPPDADILVVDGWQRGARADRTTLDKAALAMFTGALDPRGRPLHAAVVSQAAVASGIVPLAPYALVAYLLEDEGAEDLPFSLEEQRLVSDYLAGGGRLVVSGTAVGQAMVSAATGPAFYQKVLRADYRPVAAPELIVEGTAPPFAGLSFRLNETPWGAPEVVAPVGAAEAPMTYGRDAEAAVGWRERNRGVVYFGFAIDSLPDEADRQALARATLRYLGLIAE